MLPRPIFHAGPALLALFWVIAVAGCTGPAADPDPLADVQSPSAGPSVISGSTRTDTAAFGDGGARLDSARFQNLQRRGPDAVLLADVTDKGPVPEAEASVPEPVASPPAVQPATRPATRPAEPLALRTPLADGRIRLIYDLQAMGGPTIRSRADATRRHIDVQPADLGPLVALVQAQLGGAGTVSPLPAEGKLVIHCGPEAEAGVMALLSDLDRPRRQVEISARIFEVRHDLDYQQGVRMLLERIAEDGTQSALSAFSTQRLLDAAAGGTPFQGSVVSIMQELGDSGIGLDASFELLAETGLIHVVSEPRLTVAEGETGYLLAGQELPIQSADIINNALKASTKYKPVGVQLYVTPRLVGGTNVKLHTLSVVSSVAGFTPLPTLRGEPGERGNPLLLNPIIDSREAETQVTVPAGETLVISGLRTVRTVTREDKIPGLGDLPLLGHLFKNHRTQRRMSDLYFFLTPRLIHGDALAAVE
jgi:hypothetical protein